MPRVWEEREKKEDKGWLKGQEGIIREWIKTL